MSVADRVTVVFTTYNSANVIADAITALPHDVPVIVSDNASRDGTLRVIEALSQATGRRIQGLSNGANLGFSGGCNEGLKRVNTEFGVVINPDVVVAKDCLERCLAAADRNPDAAMIGCRRADLTSSGAAAEDDDDRSADAAGGRGSANSSQIVDVPGMSGAFMMLRLAAYRDIGLFDDSFFMYFEDDDLCVRTRLVGWRLLEVPDARARHARDGSTSPAFDNLLEKERIWGQSCAYFADKHRALPEGRKASRKLRNYALRRWTAALLGDGAMAQRYRARVSGAESYRMHGIAALRDNAFVRASARAQAGQDEPVPTARSD